MVGTSSHPPADDAGSTSTNGGEPSIYSLRHWQDEMWPELDETQRRILTSQRTSGKRIDELLSEIFHSGLEDPDQVRSMLAERYGLSPEDTDFLVGLSRKVDPVGYERDKQALKESFTYRDLQMDLWAWMERDDDSDRPFFAPVGGSYGICHEFLLGCYYERAALEPLVRMHSGSYRFAAVYDKLLGLLVNAQRFDLIERLWTSVTRKNRTEFFLSRSDESKRLALEAYGHAIDWMRRLGRAEAAEQLTEARDALQEERLDSLPPVSDRRRIDEPVFWELIRQARSAGPSTDEWLAALSELLRTFGASDIKRFGSLYAKNMKRLYHWNVWALGFAAMGGCSNDAFAEFRAWLILQGDPDLLDLAVREPAQAALRVPADLDLPDGPGTWMIEEAYLQRQGIPCELPMIDLDRPKGKEWREDRFEASYPELVRHYEAGS